MRRRALLIASLAGATFYAGTVVGASDNVPRCYEDSVAIVLAGSDERVCMPVDDIPELLEQEGRIK